MKKEGVVDGDGLIERVGKEMGLKSLKNETNKKTS